MNDQEIVNGSTSSPNRSTGSRRPMSARALAPEEEERLRTIEVALDQCWDLLRQRRARRHAGQDPDEAKPRPAPVVENYQQ